MKVKFRKMNELAIAPKKAHPTDAGFDIFSVEPFRIEAGGWVMMLKQFRNWFLKLFRIQADVELRNWVTLPTGIALELPVGYEAQVRPRSGLAGKHGVTVLNSPGTIDANYRGEVGVVLINHSTQVIEKPAGSAIAQLVIAPVTPCEFVEVETLNETDRGEKGFGSTDEVSHAS